MGVEGFGRFRGLGFMSPLLVTVDVWICADVAARGTTIPLVVGSEDEK
jgi:hypothetical protein